MKFISKYSNYRVVLKHGIPGEPMTGRAAVNGVYVKFEAGAADIKDEALCKQMLEHPQFNRDFVLMEDPKQFDPYALGRRSPEPEHDIMEIKHGGIEKSLNPKMLVDKDKQAILVATAKEMAKAMLKEALAEMRNEKASVEAPSAVYTTAEAPTEKKKAGRPAKAKVEEVDQVKVDA